jgi:hypothetical protein
MELKQYTEELKIKMNAEVDTVTADYQDVLLRTSHIITIVEGYIQELKQFLIKYKFKRINEEIEFFKTIKPSFVSALWYHQRLFKIQMFEAYNTNEARLKYYRKQLAKLEAFMNHHQAFYHYMLTNADHMDEKYFIRVNAAKRSGVVDERFSTQEDIRVSKILCNERVKVYLLSSIERIVEPSLPQYNSPLTWTGSKIDLIELIYSLHAAGVFNREAADIKQIAAVFENAFNVTLGNYYRVFQDIRLRKVNQIKFLDSLKQSLLRRINETDL